MTDLAIQGNLPGGDLPTPPMRPMSTGEPVTASRVRDMWDKGVKSTRQEREQAAVNSMFMRNKQWVYWNRGTGRLEEVPRSPERVRATVARVGPDSRRILAKLTRRDLAFEVPPTSPDDAAIRGSRIGESALAEAHRRQRWETIRLDHATSCWEGGVAGLMVEWDATVGTPLGVDETGQMIHTGDVRLTALSIHEISCEPGTRDIETARYWVHGVALPPKEVQHLYRLAVEPAADARAVDLVHRLVDGERTEQTPLTMVFTYYERPHGDQPGQVMTVVGNQAVRQGPWPFPFTDRLNVAVAVPEVMHARWYGHTPVSDAVQVQALYNASWSNIIEHMKLAGNARLLVPEGSVQNLEEWTDTPGEAVEYNPINGQRPQYEAPPVMPDWWIRQPQMLEKAMDDILSIHDVSRGSAPTGIESGIALSILSENDDTPVGALARQLGDCWARAASMVLKLYEARVRESRTSTVQLGSGVPEPVRWTGADLLGQTEVVVPIDAVMPRSRSAQAAYALQLYDRQIIKTPTELAKVADLPDQDDLLAGIDPDTARAQRENYWMAVGQARLVEQTDDHSNHLNVHRDFVRSERYERMAPEQQQMYQQHMQAHAMFAAQQAAQQAMAAQFSPLAAMLPTADSQVLNVQDPQTAAVLAQMATLAGSGMQPGMDGSGTPMPPSPPSTPGNSTPPVPPPLEEEEPEPEEAPPEEAT